MLKKCTGCGRPFEGRTDKKYCSNQCRSNFHNQQNRTVNNYVRNLNNILQRNRRILAGLNPKGSIVINKYVLTRLGFSFEYFTNIIVSNSGELYYFCYDQGYTHEKNEQLSLVVMRDPQHELI